MNLFTTYTRVVNEKRSTLCIALDPRVSRQDLLPTCLSLIERTGQFVAAFKPNLHYILPLSFEEMVQLTSAIHDAGALAILDSKLSDIGATNERSVQWAAEMGFDAITYSPFPGNVAEMGALVKKYGIGAFALTLMSNPEAGYFMRHSIIEGKRGYQWIAEQIRTHGLGGAVVGATHVTDAEIREIRSLVGDTTIILFPGIGAQGGDLEKVKVCGGRNILVTVGRDIITHSDPAQRAKWYASQLHP